LSNVLPALEDVAGISLELETLLGDNIGTFDDGEKALWVEPPYINAGRHVNGLQVVIDRYPQDLQPSKACIGVEQVFQRKFWRFTLVNFDVSEAGMIKFDNAIDAIQRRFPLLRERHLETVEDSFPQVSFLAEFSRIKTLITSL
jgi:hypothetical protein